MEVVLPIRILEAVGLLHQRGYTSLRVFPGMNASGTSWRISIFEASSVSDPGSNLEPDDDAECIRYSTAADNEFLSFDFHPRDSVDLLLGLIVAGLPSLRVSAEETEYTRWFAGLSEQVVSWEDLPVAYADYFDSTKGWEIGWGSDRFYPGPPVENRRG